MRARPSPAYRKLSGPALGSRPRVERLDARLLLFGGDLDPSFSSDGMASLTTTAAMKSLTAVAVGTQSDGKVLVAGNSSVSPYGNSMVVVRFNIDGSLDTSFATNGVAVVGFSGEYRNPLENVTVSALAIQGDNKIVIGGQGSDVYNPLTYGLLARLDVNGALDPTFSGNGKLLLNPYTDDYLNGRRNHVSDLKALPDGKIVVAGYVYAESSTYAYAGVARLNTDGSPDTTLDGDGNRTLDAGSGSDMARAVAVGSDGKITIVGSAFETATSAPTKILVARMLNNGNPDNTFDGDGKLTTVFTSAHTANTGVDVVVQPDGKPVFVATVGTSDGSVRNFGVVRLNVNGTRDTTFGTGNGQIEVDFGGLGASDVARSIAVGKAGRFIVGGATNDQMSIFGLDANGHYDNRFAGDGTLTTTFPDGAAAEDIVVGYGGKVLAAGGDAMATVRLFDRSDATVAIGTFNPILKEQGPTGSAFLVTREERLAYPTRVYLRYSGSALNSNPRAPRDVDFTSSGITWTSTRDGYVDIPANATFTSVTLSPLDDFELEGDETATFTVQANDAYDVLPPPSTTFYLRDNEGPPIVTSSIFHHETKPHTLEVKFNQDVSATLAASDFQFTGSAPVPARTLTYSPYGNTATITFAGDLLPDGSYTMTLPAGAVANGIGTLSTTPATLPFFVLTGDADRDRSVNFNDLLTLAKNYNQTGRDWSTGDFTYDGAVTFDDLLALAKHYNTSVAAASDAMVAAEATPTRRRTRVGEAIIV